MKTRLIDIADVIRSKNSGPYELTMDIIFKTVEDFERVWNAGVINEALISQVYQIDPDKITIKRPICSGNIGETDVYGAQQHAPLLSLSFDLNQA